MKRGTKKKGGLYEYLDQKKVLENGTAEDIQRARKEYWRLYKALWRRNNRKANKQYIISLNQEEERHIVAGARRHNRSRTAYLKEAALAYSSDRFLAPDIASIYRIKELLTMNISSITKMLDTNLLPFHAAVRLSKQLTELEGTVLTELRKPESIGRYIARAVKENPAYGQELMQFLQSLQP